MLLVFTYALSPDPLLILLSLRDNVDVQHFTVKLSDGVVASSFAPSTKFFIDPNKLLPLARFLPKAPAPKGARIHFCIIL